MIDKLINLAKDNKWISAGTAKTVTNYIIISIFTIYGYKAYEKIVTAVEKVAIVDKRIQDVESNQIQIAVELYEQNRAQNRYITGLSVAQEKSTNSIIKIQKEIAKENPNAALINYMQNEVEEQQKKNLPHYQIQRDSAFWQPKIGVRPINKIK
jgi:hypothetical protein